RRPFIEGVITGFGDKLRDQREMLKQKHEIVWVEDPGLKEFFKKRHPRLRSERLYASWGTDAFDAGMSAGAALRLTRAIRSHQGDGGRLLPG
ncbi:MAG TPA: hypothetical protein VHF22_05745, partial [Planctomycetota bacterium]|nr:hypothetical protein [Planctomycetota bacterium]